jgi:hypothetical protein
MTPDLVQEIEAQALDAARYQWLRKHIAHLLVGMLSSERYKDSLGDLSPERADFLIDRARGALPQSGEQSESV